MPRASLLASGAPTTRSYVLALGLLIFTSASRAGSAPSLDAPYETIEPPAVVLHALACAADLLDCKTIDTVGWRFPDMASCRAVLLRWRRDRAAISEEPAPIYMARCRYDPTLLRRRGQTLPENDAPSPQQLY